MAKKGKKDQIGSDREAMKESHNKEHNVKKEGLNPGQNNQLK